MCTGVVRRRSKSGTTRKGESTEVNVSDNNYEVEHNKRNIPEISRGGGAKKITCSKMFALTVVLPPKNVQNGV